MGRELSHALGLARRDGRRDERGLRHGAERDRRSRRNRGRDARGVRSARRVCDRRDGSLRPREPALDHGRSRRELTVALDLLRASHRGDLDRRPRGTLGHGTGARPPRGRALDRRRRMVTGPERDRAARRPPRPRRRPGRAPRPRRRLDRAPRGRAGRESSRCGAGRGVELARGNGLRDRGGRDHLSLGRLFLRARGARRLLDRDRGRLGLSELARSRREGRRRRELLLMDDGGQGCSAHVVGDGRGRVWRGSAGGRA